MTKRPTHFLPFSFLFFTFAFLCQSCWSGDRDAVNQLNQVRTVAGPESGIAEPFGIAERRGYIYFSDGEKGEIRRLLASGIVETFAAGFDTPSQIAFDDLGNLIVADSGSHTIESVSASGEVRVIAGVENEAGFEDGDARSAKFNAPVGVAVVGDNIYVADTYNDRIRVIEKQGAVRTIGGGERGFTDGPASIAAFDTPLGLAARGDQLLVADAGNRRLRVVEPDGRVWTLAGSGGGDLVDGLPSDASFVQPTALAVSPEGVIYVADGNAIRAIGRRTFPFVETVSNDRRGFRDGKSILSQFNRPSGLAVGENGNLIVADSDNGLIRRFHFESKSDVSATSAPKRFTAEEFRTLRPARWPYDPPEAKRDVAGTLGEIRGELKDENSRAWFHNGLDIAGAYGETARFIRDEKVLDPMSAENFDTSRELLRMPTIGYIHIRLGRDVNDRPFGDGRFIFSNDPFGKLNGIRVPRGAKFKAGEPIGTLNSLNHVHLIAGRAGAEMNALDALILPNVSDTIAPLIEKVTLTDENWREIETDNAESRIRLTTKTRIVARAFDRMDGNPERRKLGVYKLGYQLIKGDGTPASEIDWTISFSRMPPNEAVRTVYAIGSQSGPTGETIFDYIVTNRLGENGYGEDFLDPARLENGDYTLRVFAADFFGNQASKDLKLEVQN